MKSVLPSLGAALTFAAAASADPLLTFQYDNLSGNYNSGTGQFNAHAVDMAGLQTRGNFNRLVAPTSSAFFQTGFVSGADPADFTLNMSVAFVGTDIIGAGSFTAIDADGDRVTGNISGTWQLVGGQSLFNGLLSNVILHADADGIFEGTGGGSWDLASLASGVYAGAIIQLTASGNLTPTGGFSDVVTNSLGQIIVPLPSGALLGATGLGLLCARRLRHRAARRA